MTSIEGVIVKTRPKRVGVVNEVYTQATASSIGPASQAPKRVVDVVPLQKTKKPELHRSAQEPIEPVHHIVVNAPFVEEVSTRGEAATETDVVEEIDTAVPDRNEDVVHKNELFNHDAFFFGEEDDSEINAFAYKRPPSQSEIKQGELQHMLLGAMHFSYKPGEPLPSVLREPETEFVPRSSIEHPMEAKEKELTQQKEEVLHRFSPKKQPQQQQKVTVQLHPASQIVIPWKGIVFASIFFLGVAALTVFSLEKQSFVRNSPDTLPAEVQTSLKLNR